MTTQSAVAVMDEVEPSELDFTTFPAPTRNQALRIDYTNNQFEVSYPQRKIGNGNPVVWLITARPGTIASGTVVIKLTNVTTTELTESGGTVSGNITWSSTPSDVPYKVYLKDQFGTETQLQHVDFSDTVDAVYTVTILSDDPQLMVDRMGNPPNPEG